MGVLHSIIRNNLLIKLSFPGCRVWPNETGVAKTFDGERVIKFGLPGSADILGIMKCKSGAGIFLAVEVKTGNDKMRVLQKRFQAMIEAHGGLYIHATKIDETIDMVKNFIESH